jgi:outer membrane protein assembly factor BamB
LFLILAACAGVPSPEISPRTVVWSGEVRIAEDVTLTRGSRLILEPGTVVRFVYRDDDEDGWGDASLRVEGDLVARGTPSAPVIFTSEAQPAEPGGWGEVRIDFGSFDLAYTVIEGSTRGLHAHFSRGRVVDSVFRRNVDGTRFGESAITIEQCLFYGHPGKAFNARRCRNAVRRSVFHHNRHGVFLFEKDSGSTFAENVFRGNRNPFRLGDFFEGTVRTRGNDWGGTPPTVEAAADSSTVAALETSPGSVQAAGVRDWPFWEEAWKTKAEGFIDAPPVVADEGIYAAAWDGSVMRVGILDGTVLQTARLPDVVDAAPALAPEFVAVACWDRGLYLLDRATLQVLDTFRERESPADDHRQATPVFAGSRLFAATWAGFVRAFDTAQGVLRPLWSFQAGGPFRAQLALTASSLLAPSQDGSLYAFDPYTGRPRWRYDAGAPLLSGAAFDKDSAYFADRAGVLHAVDLASGRARWETRLGGPVWYAPPLLHDGVLYQGDDSGDVRALAASTGRTLWVTRLGAGVRARAAVAGAFTIAVPTLGGRLYLLDAATGIERSCWEAQGGLQSSPAVVGSRLVLGGRDGFVRALDVRLVDRSTP